MKKINWKILIIVLLIISNITLLAINKSQSAKIYELNNTIVKIDEEAGEWYSLYKEALQ